MAQQEIFLNSILNTIHRIIYVFDIENQSIIYTNQKMEEILGHTLTELQASKLNFFSTLFHDDDIQNVKNEIATILLENKKTNYKNEYRLKTINSTYKWFEFNTTIYKQDSNNKVIQLLIDAREIAEQPKQEKNLSQNEFKDLINRFPNIIYKFSNKKGGLFCSESVVSVLGFSAQEINDTPFIWYNSICDQYKEKVLKAVSEMQVGKSSLIEYQIKTKSGKIIWLSDFFMRKSILGDEIIIEGQATDITSYKQIEQELKESERKFRELAENSTSIIYRYLLKPEPKFDYVSSASTKVTGYTPQEHYNDPYLGYKIIHEEDRKILEDASSLGNSEPIILRWIRKDGQIIWTEQQNILLYDKNNELYAIEGTARDITEAKLAEIELLKAVKNLELSEKKARALVKAIPDMLFIMDKKGVYLDYKANKKDLYYKEKSILGLNAKDIMPKDFYDTLILKMVETLNTDRIVIFNYQLSSENGIRDYEARMVKNGENEIFSIVRDTTIQRQNELYLQQQKEEYSSLYQEYKQQNEQLRQAIKTIEEASEKFSFLYENMIQGVVYQNAKGEIIQANKAAQQILGLSFEQMQGVKSIDSRWQAIHLDGSDFQGATHPAMVSLETGKTVLGEIMGVFNPKNNAYTWISINSFPKFKPNESEPYLVIATFEDITQIKTTTEKLIKAKEKAEESDKLKSAFLRNISHEIRTPMNSITGFAKLLTKPNITPEKQIQFYQNISKSVTQLLNVVENIITISYIETNQMKTEAILFSPDKLILDLYEEFQQFKITINKQHIALKYSISETQKIVLCTDYTKLKQIIRILLDNAFKFTGSGSIEFGYYLISENILFFVKDTGIGIPKQKQKIIFKTFAHADENIPKLFGGIGLGLPIATGLIKMIGGKMYLNSEPEQGTEISFELPLDGSKIEQNNIKTKQNTKTPWSAKTLLVAEDEEFNFLYIEEILSDSGLTLLRAQNGKEAIDICKNSTIDIVLMDLKMPIIDGFEAVKQIREFDMEIPIIAQTAFSFKRELCIISGFTDYIAKPFSDDQLLNILKLYI